MIAIVIIGADCSECSEALVNFNLVNLKNVKRLDSTYLNIYLGPYDVTEVRCWVV